jgi:hypothetical protein
MSFVENAAMPLVDTPSIAQQRTVLAVLVVVIGAGVWWQNTGVSSDYPVQKYSQTAVPDVSHKLDFTSAEAAWSGLTIDSQGNLNIDALTESALVDALAMMNEQTSEQAMMRMAFLLKKQFGLIASQQILELLPILKTYKEAEQRWWETNGSRTPPPHAELFQLQDQLLGEKLAKTMFSEQRRLLNMMQAIQQIRTDASLTETQKEQALMDLQQGVPEEDASIE